MNKSTGSILQGAVQDIFNNNNKIIDGSIRRQGAKTTLPKAQLELALSVLLVDLAGCDQNFDMQEYNVIQNGMMRVFGTTKTEVTALINQANLTLKNLRGTARFASLLKDNLDQKQREVIMQVVEDVIAADGVEDGFETYLRHKFADLLGVTIEKSEAPPQAPDTN